MPPPESAAPTFPEEVDAEVPPAGNGSSSSAEEPRLPPLEGSPATLACTARLAGSAVLPAACAGEPYFTRIQLECSDTAATLAASAVQWLPSSLPAELTLTPQGELLGSAALRPGVHALRARASLAGRELEVSLQLQVLERCFLFAVARSTAGTGGEGPSRLLAQRLDAAQALWLPERAPVEAEVLGFDLSADGRWLAARGSSPTGQRLLLFQVMGGRVVELALQHTGTHVAHAFSPDSSRLAVITELASDPSAPPDRRLSLVDLAALAAEATPLTLEEAFELPYQTGLGWADGATLQLIGVSALFPTYFAPYSVHIPAEGMAAAELSELLYPMDPADLLHWFRPLPDGFLLMTNALSYVNADATLAALHLEAQALSPSYELVGRALDGQLLLHTPDVGDEQPPTFSADGCDRLLAWSDDGRALLCAFGGQLTQLQLADGALTATPITSTWSAAGMQRSVVSQRGQWSVVSDAEHGLFLLARGEPAPDTPLLAASPAEPGWDFAISRDERHLWVQRGRRLSLVALDSPGSSAQPEEGALRHTLLSETMGPPSSCAESGLPLPESWCGSPELPGRVRLRPEGRYLAFADESGALTLVDMLVPARRRQPGARLATACTERCIQFQ